MTAPSTRILDLEGDEILDLAPADGYRRSDLPAHGVIVEVQVETALRVDGETATSWKRAALPRTVIVRVDGADWVEVETRVEALMDAVCDAPFLYEQGLGGVTRVWRSVGPASAQATFSPADIVLNRQFVTLDFRVQPTPTITGV